jgi:MFS family permease
MTLLKFLKDYEWWLLALLYVAYFLQQSDRAIYGVVVSAIKKDLQLIDSQIGLVGTVRFSVLTLMLPIAGDIRDLFDREVGCHPRLGFL